MAMAMADTAGTDPCGHAPPEPAPQTGNGVVAPMTWPGGIMSIVDIISPHTPPKGRTVSPRHHDRSGPVSSGRLYPGFGAEDDFPALQARLGDQIRLPLVNTIVSEDAHRVDALLDLGNPARLAEGASRLLERSPDAIMWPVRPATSCLAGTVPTNRPMSSVSCLVRPSPPRLSGSCRPAQPGASSK